MVSVTRGGIPEMILLARVRRTSVDSGMRHHFLWASSPPASRRDTHHCDLVWANDLERSLERPIGIDRLLGDNQTLALQDLCCNRHPMAQAWAMVASVEQLVELASQASALRDVLDAGDWYLVGSRATGHSDDLSDWDTILLVPGEPVSPDPDQAAIDAVFKIVRPPWTGSAILEFDRSWRAVHGVDVEMVGRNRPGRTGSQVAVGVGVHNGPSHPAPAPDRLRGAVSPRTSR